MSEAYKDGMLRAADMLFAALKAKIQMEGRNGVHKKLDDHLIWRENDILAQKMADEAIAAYEAIRAEAEQQPKAIPDGYAVRDSSGYWSGIWKDRETAELVLKKGKGGEEILAMRVVDCNHDDLLSRSQRTLTPPDTSNRETLEQQPDRVMVPVEPTAEYMRQGTQYAARALDSADEIARHFWRMVLRAAQEAQ